MSKSNDPNDISCLYGIRSICLLHITLGHRFGIPWWEGYILNTSRIFEFLGEWHVGIYQVHSASVNVFFLMGGLLATMSIMKSLDRKQLKIWRLYWRRYLRYTPILVAIVLIFITYLKKSFFGPLTGFMDFEVPKCEKWWWTTFLHIQNYVHGNKLVSDKK
jgi:peptidoglycan/LPS O-acetylase OafA/YrhL